MDGRGRSAFTLTKRAFLGGRGGKERLKSSSFYAMQRKSREFHVVCERQTAIGQGHWEMAILFSDVLVKFAQLLRVTELIASQFCVKQWYQGLFICSERAREGKEWVSDSQWDWLSVIHQHGCFLLASVEQIKCDRLLRMKRCQWISKNNVKLSLWMKTLWF